jgi:predicted phosphodiesterase
VTGRHDIIDETAWGDDVTRPAVDWTATVAGGPILVFGGPYSNLRATEAMRQEADRLGIPPRRVICTGDVVAYAAEPEETTRAIIQWGCHVIAGNCEEQIGAGAADCGCGFEEGTACDAMAKGWYPFANARVSDGSRAWMQSLPPLARFTIGGITATVTHGGLNQNNRFLFASDRQAIKAELNAAGTDVVIGGHAGIPFAVKDAGRLWFNPGVIGMPANDGTPDVWYGLITEEAAQVSFALKRLSYAHQRAAAAMRRWAHADGYATTLVTGIWPSLDVLPDAEKAATGKRLRARSWTMQKPAQASAIAAE